MPIRPRSRNWVFTLNNPTEDLDLTGTPDLVYAVWQLEQGITGTFHYQGYLMFSKLMYRTTVARILPMAHLEVARGTPKQCRDYCTKVDTQMAPPFEIGIFPGTSQGTRTDLCSLQKAFDSGLTDAEYATLYFDDFKKYPNLLANYITSQIAPRDPSQPICCRLFIGEPGLGKSRYAFYLSQQLFGGVYRKFPGKWYDGYRGERAIIIDDFRGHSLSFTEFKLLIDRYPLRVEIKGSTCNMAATEFFITSNTDPSEWWSQEVVGNFSSAIFRRIDEVFHFVGLNQFRHYTSYSSYRAFNNDGSIAPQTFIPPIQTISYPEDIPQTEDDEEEFPLWPSPFSLEEI